MTTALNSDTREFAWTVEQGERERITIPVFDDQDDPYDITGWSVDARVKTAPGGELLYLWPANQITVTGSSIELVIPGPVSALWTWTEGWWRVVITAPDQDPADPDVFRIIQGSFTVAPD